MNHKMFGQFNVMNSVYVMLTKWLNVKFYVCPVFFKKLSKLQKAVKVVIKLFWGTPVANRYWAPFCFLYAKISDIDWNVSFAKAVKTATCDKWCL